MKCSICGRPIESRSLEINGIKVPPLCDRHMRWVNQALDNQKKCIDKQEECYAPNQDPRFPRLPS